MVPSIDKTKYYTPTEVLNILVAQGCNVKSKVKTAHGEKSALLASLGYKGNSGTDHESIIALVKSGVDVNEEGLEVGSTN